MQKMTKAQAKRRLIEARAKISKVMMNDNAIVYLTPSDMKKCMISVNTWVELLLN